MVTLNIALRQGLRGQAMPGANRYAFTKNFGMGTSKAADLSQD